MPTEGTALKRLTWVEGRRLGSPVLITVPFTYLIVLFSLCPPPSGSRCTAVVLNKLRDSRLRDQTSRDEMKERAVSYHAKKYRSRYKLQTGLFCLIFLTIANTRIMIAKNICNGIFVFLCFLLRSYITMISWEKAFIFYFH